MSALICKGKKDAAHNGILPHQINTHTHTHTYTRTRTHINPYPHTRPHPYIDLYIVGRGGSLVDSAP